MSDSKAASGKGKTKKGINFTLYESGAREDWPDHSLEIPGLGAVRGKHFLKDMAGTRWTMRPSMRSNFKRKSQMKFSTKLAYQVTASIAALSLFAAPPTRASEKAAAAPNIAERVKELDKQLFTGKDAIKVEPQDVAAMTKAAEELALKLPAPGLQAGAKAPDFSLKNAHGKRKKLSRFLRHGPVVLVFYRGAWCPYCNLELHALNESLPEIKKLGATLIAVTPQTPDKSLVQVNQDGYPFEILSDLDDSVIKAYKLYWEVSPELDAAYKHGFGLDVTAYNGKGRRGLPVPGTFVIDKSGTVRAAFADVDYKKRMEPVAILAALQNIKDSDGRR